MSTQLCNTRKYIERGYGPYIMEAMAYYVYLLTAVIVLINVTMTTNHETYGCVRQQFQYVSLGFDWNLFTA